MDIIDGKILEILAANANATTTEISAAINLSVPAVNKRIQKLQREGVIRSFTVLTDGVRVGKPITAFIFLVMRYGEGVEVLQACVERDPDILECHAVTGEYDYLIKVCAEDVASLENKLLQLKRQKGVVKSHTMLSLMEHKFQPTVLPTVKNEDREDRT